MTTSVPRRSYDSPRRREQAQATRLALLDAARDLFIERGYVATTIEAVAERAHLSPETVYATFGNKRTLLSTVFDVAIVGDDAPQPLLARRWVLDMREAVEPRDRIAILAHNAAGILKRIAPIVEVVRAAAPTDPAIAELWSRYTSQRLAGQRALVRIVGRDGALRPGLSTTQAADTLFALGSPEVYRLLTVDRGWSPGRYQRWFGDTLAALLLA